MHILTLTTLFPNSLQPIHAVFVRARMEAFVRRFGHRWSVVAPVPWFPRLPFKVNPRYDTWARVPAREDARGYPVYHPRYLVTPGAGMRYYGSWLARGAAETVRRIHREHPVDAIDGHYLYPDGTAAAELGAEIGVPVILSARGTDLNVFPEMPAIRPLIEENLRRSRALICVSRDLKAKALALGVPDGKISVVGNGVDVERFRRGDRGQARARLGLPGDVRLFLSVGNLVEGKGFHLVLEALAGLPGDAHLAVAGHGPLRKSLEAQAANLGMGKRVRFVGGVPNEELPAWYQAADFFVLASAREGWPNVVTEAQACGLPVVAVRVSGIPDIVTDESLGILIARRETAALREAMGQALERTWDREHIARTGQSRTWDSVADELARVFAEVAPGRS